MRRNWLLALAALMLVALAAYLARPSGPPTFAVWVFAGQSNMVGNFAQADYDALAPALRDQPAVAYYNASPAICAAARAAWGSLRPLCNSYRAWSFGPELSFAQSMRGAPVTRLAIVKYALNDTSLHEDWRPGAASAKCAPDGAGCYAALIAAVEQAVVELRAANPGARVELAGIVWVQGETDADPARAGAAAAYGANLRALIDALRQDLAPHFAPAAAPPPFLYSRLHRDNFFGAAAEVIAAQESVAADPPPRTVMVPVDEVQLGPDRLHYTAAGQEQLGRLLAEGAR